MTRYRIFVAAMMLSATSVAPALAQQAIDEPGLYAFYHPNADLSQGVTRPADAMASGSPRQSENLARYGRATMYHPLPAKRSVKTY
jgi:hypothetical protein